MGRPYIPGIWAKKYEQLSRQRKDSVIFEVNRIFKDQTGIKRKLDPKKDKEMIRIWLRIRDDVMSGASKLPLRFFLRVDGVDGSSTDPLHQGWIDVNTARVVDEAAGIMSISMDSGIFREGELLRSLTTAEIHPTAVVQIYKSLQLIFTATMKSVFIAGARHIGAQVEVDFNYRTIAWEIE